MSFETDKRCGFHEEKIVRENVNSEMILCEKTGRSKNIFMSPEKIYLSKRYTKINTVKNRKTTLNLDINMF